MLREECWSRPEEEDLDQEFLALFDSSGELRLEDYKVAKDNLEIFCRLNDLNFTSSTDSVPIDKTLKPIVVLNLDEALFSLPDLRDSRDSKVRHAAQDLYECVKDVAKCCFFFNDVRDFDQPHCLYYRDEDDGRSLEGYDFKADELVEYLQGRSTEKEKKFYRERAFRYRMASIRYESNQNLEGSTFHNFFLMT